jgi:hypothetical protein
MQRDVLLECAYESLSIFGENTRHALLARLQKQGLEFTPEGFDIIKFCSVTHELLGSSADFVFVKIIDDFCNRSRVSLEESGFARKAKYLSHSDILISLFSKVKDGTFDRRA